MKICVYCFKKIDTNSGNKDHVFPDSWYPDSTPNNVQRWKVPACKKCNSKFQVAEDELFVRWGIGVEPGVDACLGIHERAMKRIAFLGVKDFRRFRRKLSVLRKIVNSLHLWKPETTHAGMTPKPGVRTDMAVLIPKKFKDLFSKKLIKGTEFKLRNKYIRGEKRIRFFYEMSNDPLRGHYIAWERLLSGGETINLGPGFCVKWAVDPNNTERSLYCFDIWGHIRFWGLVYPKKFSEEILYVAYNFRSIILELFGLWW